MQRSITIFAVACILSVASATAQPSAQQIVDRVAQAYEAMMADVDSYLMSIEMMGMQHQWYFERIDGGGPLDFRPQVRIVGQTGWTDSGDDTPGSVTIPTSEMMERLRTEARFAGEQTLKGTRVYALEVDDPQVLMNQGEMPTDGEFEFDKVTLFISTSNYMLIGMDGSGTMTQNGRTSPVTMEMRASDFRTAGPMTHPFLTTMRFEGMTAGMSEQERRQLEEARRQMEQMPPEQREMMERMMGDQLERLQAMIDGEALEMEMRVTDLEVNVPRP